MPSANGSSFMLSVRSRNGSTATVWLDAPLGRSARASSRVVGQRPRRRAGRRLRARRTFAISCGRAAEQEASSTVRLDRGDQPIAEPRHGDDVRRLLRIVAEQAAQRRDCLVDGIRRDDHARPDLAEQRVDADDFARTLGETQQQPHRARFQPDAFLAAGDFAGQRIHEPVADAQGFRGRVFHTRATIAPAPQQTGPLSTASELLSAVSGLRRTAVIVRRRFIHRSCP